MIRKMYGMISAMNDGADRVLAGRSHKLLERDGGLQSRERARGDQAASNALWVIAHVRTISDPRTRAFVAKRTATGNSRREIMRMLQRYIARELYPLIIEALRTVAT